MATLTRGYTFGSSESVTNTKLHTLVDSGSCTAIVNADVASNAAIAYSKLDLSASISDADISSSAAIAITKLAYDNMWPIGSVYSNKTVSTNPSILFGFGTWVAITDRIIVAKGSVFTTAGATGGASSVTLTTNELPASGLAVTGPTYGGGLNGGGSWNVTGNTGNGSTGTQSIGTTANMGNGSSFSIMNPYVVAYVWERTA